MCEWPWTSWLLDSVFAGSLVGFAAGAVLMFAVAVFGFLFDLGRALWLWWTTR